MRPSGNSVTPTKRSRHAESRRVGPVIGLLMLERPAAVSAVHGHGEPTCTVASPGVGILIKLVAGGQRDQGLAQHVFPAVSPKLLDHGRPILPLTRAISAPALILLSTSVTCESFFEDRK